MNKVVMKKKIFVSACLFFLLCGLRAEAKLIAYPVPFDPNHQILHLMYSPALPAGSVKVQVFDVNGDLVVSRSLASIADFIWKGYTDSGRRVSTGLYIVKVRWEDQTTGKVKTDIVRVTLVERSR